MITRLQLTKRSVSNLVGVNKPSAALIERSPPFNPTCHGGHVEVYNKLGDELVRFSGDISVEHFHTYFEFLLSYRVLSVSSNQISLFL